MSQMEKNDFLYNKKGIFGGVLIGVIGSILSIFMGGILHLWLKNEDRSIVDEWAQAMATEVRSEMITATEVIRTLKNVILFNKDFAEPQFDLFVSTSLKRFPALRELYWVEKRLNHDQDDLYALAMTYPKRGVYEGQAVLNQPKVKRLIDGALRTQHLLLSARENPTGSKALGYWAVMPVENISLSSEGGNRGIVLGFFDLSHTIEALFKSKKAQLKALRLQDVTVVNNPVLLFSNGWDEGSEPTDRTIFQVNVAGRVLDLEFVARQGKDDALIALLVSLLGIGVTGLLVLGRLKHHRYESQLADAINRQTSELTNRNLFYNTVMNSAGEGVIGLNRYCVVSFANRLAHDFFDKQVGDVVGEHLSGLIGQESVDHLVFKDVEDGSFNFLDVPYVIELEREHASQVRLEVRIISVLDVPDVRWLLVFRDISKEIEIEEMLEQTDRQFRQAFLLGSVPMMIVDAEGFVKETNKAFQDFVGYRQDELFTRHMESFLHLSGRDAFMSWLDGARRHMNENLQIEQRILSAAGETLWTVASYTCVYGKAGKLEKIICQYLDYTERQKFEVELRKHRDKLAQLVATRTREVKGARESLIASINAADNAILVYDNQNKLEFSSGQVEVFFPEMAMEIRPGVPAKRLCELQALRTGENEAKQAERIARLSAGVSGEEIQLVDGRWIQTRRRKTPAGGTIVVYTDITSFKDQQELLRRQADDLSQALRRQQEVNEQQKMFVSVVSHEFKNPLAIIDSTAQRISRRLAKLEPQEIIERMQTVRDAVLRLSKLIDATVTTQRIENQSGKLEANLLEVTQTVRDIVAAHKDALKDRQVMFKGMDVPVHAPLDEELFAIAMDNLINNAIKFSPKGSVITLHVKREDSHVIVGVSDQGMGIAKGDLENIYNRFYRAQAAGDVEGTGLGLSIVRQIAHLHKGEVHCESEEGKWTYFYMRLPLFV